jgi:hypothetical protein
MGENNNNHLKNTNTQIKNNQNNQKQKKSVPRNYSLDETVPNISEGGGSFGSAGSGSSATG